MDCPHPLPYDGRPVQRGRKRKSREMPDRYHICYSLNDLFKNHVVKLKGYSAHTLHPHHQFYVHNNHNKQEITTI